MKQFLIVLLATAAVFVGWRVYSGSSSDQVSKTDRRELAPKPPKDQRPKTGQAPREKGLDGKKVEILDAAPEGDEQGKAKMQLEDEGSWTQYVQEDDVVKLEDAWAFDFDSIDYDAPVLAVIETPGGSRVEITQNDWRRYVSLTKGSSLVRSELLAKRGREVAEEFGEVYGFTDDGWNLVVEGLAKSKGLTVDEYRFQCSQDYSLREEGAMRVRRNSIEGIIAHLPRVNDVSELPELSRQIIEDHEDRNVLMTVAAAIREGRKNLHDPGDLASLVSMIDTAFVMFTRTMPDHEFKNTWCFLDGEMPEDAIAACTVGKIETSELQPPWLQPGEISYATVEEVWPLVSDLTSEERVSLLREFVWFDVLENELERSGQQNTPEENWLTYAEDHTRRNKGLFNLSAHSSAVARFPSTHHYRAFMGLFWSFRDHQPEGWDEDENLRAFYARNRIFIEMWTPAIEVILFPAMAFEDEFDEDGFDIDWEGAKRKAEEARARVLAGEEDFTVMRNRLHTELRERLIKAGLHEIADRFDESFQNGMLAGRMPVVERSFSESPFQLMVDTTSVTGNAVARLDPGEISPVWRVPNGYAVLRVHGVVAADLEGAFEDYKADTKVEYSRAQFRKWANDVLRNSKLSN